MTVDIHCHISPSPPHTLKCVPINNISQPDTKVIPSHGDLHFLSSDLTK